MGGRYPLMMAAGHGHESVVDYILQQDHWQVDCVDKSGKTALHHAAMRPRSEVELDWVSMVYVARLLVQAKFDVNLADSNKRTPLMHAAANGAFKLAEVLMEHGAYMSLVDGFEQTALDYALHLRNDDVAKLLEKAGAKPGKAGAVTVPPKAKERPVPVQPVKQELVKKVLELPSPTSQQARAL